MVKHEKQFEKDYRHGKEKHKSIAKRSKRSLGMNHLQLLTFSNFKFND